MFRVIVGEHEYIYIAEIKFGFFFYYRVILGAKQLVFVKRSVFQRMTIAYNTSKKNLTRSIDSSKICKKQNKTKQKTVVGSHGTPLVT